MVHRRHPVTTCTQIYKDKTDSVHSQANTSIDGRMVNEYSTVHMSVVYGIQLAKYCKLNFDNSIGSYA